MPSNQFTRVEKLVGDCEDWQSVTFENSWVNFNSATHETAQYYKDPFNVVHIKGFVKSGTVDATIFTLPEGYRPALKENFAVIDGTANAVRLEVDSAGTVKTLTAGAGSTAYQSLNVSFRV